MVEGYKHTEVGLIPEDWEVLSYGEIFVFLNTATYSRDQLTENDEIGYVHYGDIHVRCLHFLDLDKITLPTIKKDLLKNYPTIKDGDLIIVDASEDYEGVGKSVEVRNLKSRKVISGLHTFLLRDKEEKIANGFKGYIQSNKVVKKQMDTLATGLKVYGVSKSNLKKILIPLPPTKAEQTAIATVLSDADALIEKLEQLIAKKRLIKQGAMQELLKPKEGWEVKKLGEIAEIKKGQLITEKTAVPDGIPVIGGGMTVSYYHNKPNRKGITITISASGAYAGYVSIHNYPIFASDCSTISQSEEYDIYYLYFCLLNKQREIYALQTGGGQPHVYPQQLRDLLIPIPKSKSEQTRIAQILSDMDNEIEALEKQLEKYKKIKQGMMQVLLTGKIRLVKPVQHG